MRTSAFFSVFIALISFLLFSSCEMTPDLTPSVAPSSSVAKNGNGKGKGHQNDEDDDPVDDNTGPVITYMLEVSGGEGDPLYQFSFLNSGTEVLMQTDPSVTSWGTDFWGTWADPFQYNNGIVNYIKGLTNVTYEFTPLPNDRFDVTSTVIVQPYPSGTPRTSVKYAGTYRLVN